MHSRDEHGARLTRTMFLPLILCAMAALSAPAGAQEGAKKGRMLEWSVDLDAGFKNPYNPDEVALDAVFRTPSGREMTVPGFYMEPCSKTSESPAARLKDIALLRFFLPAERWPQNGQAVFFFDDIVLSCSRTGEKVVLYDFEGDTKWDASSSVKCGFSTDPAHGGKRSLSADFIVIDKEKERWPGLGAAPAVKDWSRFDTLTLWVYCKSSAKTGTLGIEFYNAAREKFQHNVSLGQDQEAPLGQWNQVTWTFAPKQPMEKWQVSGPGEWRLRFTPMEAGEYSFCLLVKEGSKTTASAPRWFSVANAPTDGFLRVSRGDRRYLALDSGRPYFANGFNLISRNTAEYDYFFEKMQKIGCNFVRIWMTPFGGGLESETLGRYKQEAAAGIDCMLDSARRHGVYVMMCIVDYREASSRDAWDKNVYNAARGGPCETAPAFFSNPVAKEFFKKRLRYLVARWGAYTAVHSWEFWNEVDITDGWRETPDEVRVWHREMSRFLRQNDPYGHLVTTSFAGVYDGDVLWESRRMDVVQTHRYIGDKIEDFGDILVGFCRQFARYRKPYHIGEFGLFNHGQRVLDTKGVSLHNGLWSAIVNGSCSTPMSWWWEWIDANDLYTHYAAVTRFVEGIDWPAEGFGPLKNAELVLRNGPPTVAQRLCLTPKAGSFHRASYNRENTFEVDAQGSVARSGLLSRYLHGLDNHPDLHNPQIFKLVYPEDGQLSFGIEGVSGYGGAHLKVWLDSTVALEKDFPDDDKVNDTIHKFDGEYTIQVPKGYHTIKVENIGKDWFVLTYYKFFNVNVPVPIHLQGLQGDRTTLAWVWNSSSVWYAKRLGAQPVSAEGVQVRFWGLRPGPYRVAIFDTWSGEEILARSVEIAGGLRVSLPPIEKDMAVKLERR